MKFFSGNTSSNLPVFHQSESSECGLACVAMIANFHGQRLSLSEMRRKTEIPQQGLNLQQLIEVAFTFKLQGRAVKLDVEDCVKISCPAILHWNLDHFVVLKSANGKGAVIHDPANGEMTLSWSEMSKSFTGIALELKPTDRFVKETSKERLKLRHMVRATPNFFKTLSQIFVLSLMFQISILALPLYSQLLIDDVLVSRDSSLLFQLTGVFIVVAFFALIFESLRGTFTVFLSNQINYQMTSKMFQHLLSLPTSFFERRHIGDIISKFGSLDNVREIISKSAVQAIIDGILCVFTIAIMLIYSPWLTLITISFTFVYLVFRLVQSRELKIITNSLVASKATEQSHFVESVRAIRTLKVYGIEQKRLSAWKNLFVNYLNSDIDVGRLKVRETAGNFFLFALENILLLFAGILLILNNDLTLGMLFAFIAFKSSFVLSIARVIDELVKLQVVRVHLQRIADISFAQSEQYQNNNSIDDNYKSLNSLISLSGITYRYSDYEQNILNKIDLDIKEGESIAIVGMSGSGKSTLLKIVCGLVPPTSGSIKYKNNLLNGLNYDSYRKDIAVVMQDDQLLSGTILENITFFDSQPDQEYATLCATIAKISDDIDNLPMKFDSFIGDMGSSLSGGQKQRLLIARALYKRPKVIFFDEATSSLDLETESKINRILRTMKMTKVSIAHRPDTVKNADRIFSLESGCLREIRFEDWYGSEEVKEVTTELDAVIA